MSTPASESRKIRQRHSEASHKMTTRHHPYPPQLVDSKEMERLRKQNEAYRTQIQLLQEADLHAQKNHRSVVDDYNELLNEKEETDKENEKLREQVQQLEESKVQENEKFRQLVLKYNQLVQQYEELKGDIEKLESEVEESNEKWMDYSKDMEEKLEEAEKEKENAEEEVETMKEHFKIRRENMAQNMSVLREQMEEKDKEIEKWKNHCNEINHKAYAFRSRQVKRRLFHRLDDKLEFGDEKEQKAAERDIKTMRVMLRKGEEINELIDVEN
ncbi:hypothetical protein CRE_08338 [Caenorhabditis remanei]|uniref:Uncharacterized protein n=1 Tax=Caenorhabditis remanei TaxID=31234 RepID=E3MPH4_CAERE|nr:hypothetical protein CRE_08338 [Caenorhabditis remanei]